LSRSLASRNWHLSSSDSKSSSPLTGSDSVAVSTYDIDFFLTGQPSKMKVTETSVHKIDGKPLYNWKEENGKWQKVPATKEYANTK
jgi:hypothetical protein